MHRQAPIIPMAKNGHQERGQCLVRCAAQFAHAGKARQQNNQRSTQVRSYIGYHCGRGKDFRDACKIAFRVWSEALRQTELDLNQKSLRKMQTKTKKDHARWRKPKKKHRPSED